MMENLSSMPDDEKQVAGQIGYDSLTIVPLDAGTRLGVAARWGKVYHAVLCQPAELNSGIDRLVEWKARYDETRRIDIGRT